MPTIVIGLTYLSHFSDVLRSELLRYLVANYRVVVLTPTLDSKTAAAHGYLQHPHLEYRPYQLRHPKLWVLFDKYLRHAFVRSYDDFFVTRWWYYRSTHPLLIRFLTAIGSFFPRNFLSSGFFTWLESILIRPAPMVVGDGTSDIPVLLLTATPGFTPLEAELIVSAHKLKIPTMAIALNVDNPTGKGKFLRKTDYIVAWHDRMREEIIRFNRYEPHQVISGGCLRFDHYAEDLAAGRVRSRGAFLISKDLAPERKTIVYATSTPIAYPPRKAFMEALVGLKQTSKLVGDPNILVRLHPHDVWEPYEDFLDIPGIRIERAGHQRVADTATKGQKVEMQEEDLVNLTETMLYADVVVNYSSTTTLEACIFHKPVVGIAFPPEHALIYEYEANQVQLASHVVEPASSVGELEVLLNKYLLHPEVHQKEREQYLQEYVQFTDGLSWKRCADFIDAVIRK